ncbi:MAG: hypothetical protein J7J36_06520, partial [Thermoplasmata archaeon]|nr:hypothetical protein [Thermoplasmata archaeon]
MKLFAILLAFIFFSAFSTATHVSLNSPHGTIVNEEFDLYVDVNVSNFDAANYSIFYPDSFEIVNITSGIIKNYTIPISDYHIGNGTCRVMQNMPGIGNVTGNGYLSIIKFKVNLPGKFFINISGTMSNSYGNEINTSWNGTEINVFKTIVKLISPENALMGSTIKVNVSVMNITDFNCTNFDLVYNENMFNFMNFSSLFNYTYNVINGTIKAFVKSNGSMNGNFSIAGITFKCVAAGRSNFTIDNITVSNSDANKIPVYLINSSTHIYFDIPPVANFSYSPANPTTSDIIQFNDLSH